MAVKPACPACGWPIPAVPTAAAVHAARSAEGRKVAPKVGRPRSADRCPCQKWTKAYAAKKYHHCEEKKR